MLAMISMLDLRAAKHTRIALGVFFFAFLCILLPSAGSIQYADSWMRKASTVGSLTTIYDAYGRQGIMNTNGTVSYSPSDYGNFIGFTVTVKASVQPPKYWRNNELFSVRCLHGVE
jgi:hypothetical protein